ncbi:MAG: ATP synthase subunit I [Pseudomonadota bacterium]
MSDSVSKLLKAQAAVTFVIALVLAVLQDRAAAVSALAGGAVGFLTSWVYAKRMFAGQSTGDLKKIVRAQYMAEAYKLVFTILLFSVIFTQFKDVRPLPLFAAYGATLAVYWAALFFV